MDSTGRQTAGALQVHYSPEVCDGGEPSVRSESLTGGFAWSLPAPRFGIRIRGQPGGTGKRTLTPSTSSPNFREARDSLALCNFKRRRGTRPSMSQERRTSVNQVSIQHPFRQLDFKTSMCSLGYKITPFGEYNTIESGTFLEFKTALRKLLSDDANDFLNNFIRSLVVFMNVRENLIDSLRGTRHEVEILLPSLMTILLGVQELLPTLIPLVFNVLMEWDLSDNADRVTLIASLLGSMKYHQFGNYSSEFYRSFVNHMGRVSNRTKCMLLRSASQILPLEHHEEFSKTILNMLQSTSDHDIFSSLIDAFGMLDLPQERVLDLMKLALSRAKTANLAQLCSFVRLLFRQDLEERHLLENVWRFRLEVMLDSPAVKAEASNSDGSKELVESLKLVSLMCPKLYACWKQARKSNNLPPTKMDIILLSVFTMTMGVEQTFVDAKSMFSSAYFAEGFAKIRVDNKKVLEQIFPGLLDIVAVALTHKRDTCSTQTVCSVLKESFAALSGQKRRDTVLTLLRKFSSNDAVPIVLADLASTSARELAPFGDDLLSLYRGFHELSGRNRRILIQTLGRLACFDSGYGGRYELYMKDVFSGNNTTELVYGVYGITSTIRALTTSHNMDANKILSLVELMRKGVEKNEFGVIAFLDEMFQHDILDVLPSVVLNKLWNWLTDVFFTTFVHSLRGGSNNLLKSVPSAELSFGNYFVNYLDPSSASHIISLREKIFQVPSLGVPSLFRALFKLSQRMCSQESLELEAVLSVGVEFPEVENFAPRIVPLLNTTQRVVMAKHLLLTINLFREQISAYSSIDDYEVRVKVVSRLEQLVALQEALSEDNEHFPVIPWAYPQEEIVSSKREQYTKTVAGLIIGLRKPKDSSEKLSCLIRTDTETEAAPAAINWARLQSTCTKQHLLIQPKAIRPFLRKMEDSVFDLLSHDLGTRHDFGTFSDMASFPCAAHLNKRLVLTPNALILLLSELRDLVDEKAITLTLFDPNKELFLGICKHMTYVLSQLHATKMTISNQLMYDHILALCYNLLGVYTSVRPEDRLSALPRGDPKRALLMDAIAKILKGPRASSSGATSDIHDEMDLFFDRIQCCVRSDACVMSQVKLFSHVFLLLGKPAELAFLTSTWPQRFLQRRSPELSSATVKFIIDFCLDASAEPLEAIKGFTHFLLSERKMFSDEHFRACNEKNFGGFFKGLFEHLVLLASEELCATGTWSSDATKWNEVALLLFKYTSIAKTQVKSKVLHNVVICSILNNIGTFFRVFSMHSSEIQGQGLVSSTNKYGALVQRLQAISRTLHAIINHVKLRKNLKLLPAIPRLRKDLEEFVLTVRETVALAGKGKSFEQFDLVNKELNGNPVECMEPGDSGGELIDYAQTSEKGEGSSVGNQPSPDSTYEWLNNNIFHSFYNGCEDVEMEDPDLEFDN